MWCAMLRVMDSFAWNGTSRRLLHHLSLNLNPNYAIIRFRSCQMIFIVITRPKSFSQNCEAFVIAHVMMWTWAKAQILYALGL